MTRRVIPPDDFVSAMNSRWESFGNVSSGALRKLWRQLAVTFNTTIKSNGFDGSSSPQRWRVLQPPTGTGKSQGLALYAAMLSTECPPEEHPGALIVVRLKAQADELAGTINELAGTINELAGASVALAHHSSSESTSSDLGRHPVLIITHRAFEIGLDAVSRDNANQSGWSSFMSWGARGRQLVVVDEALDVVEHAQTTLPEVRLLLALLPTSVQSRYPKQMDAIRTAERVLTELERLSTSDPELCREKCLRVADLPLPKEYDFTELRKELRGLPLDIVLSRVSDPTVRARHARHYDDTLKAVQRTLEDWSWYARAKAGASINTARLIVPEDSGNVVVLDATAESNLVYDLFAGTAEVLAVPSASRRYDNVNLHVSLGHSVGKSSLKDGSLKKAHQFVGALEATLGPDRRVFAVGHLFMEPHLKALAPNFADWAVGHWGALDGRNEWSDHDAIAIFGLPYRDNVWSGNVTQAFLGPQTTEWLRASGERPYGNHPDVRRALEDGQLVVSLVQAINRIRCRRVIDGEGNCAPVDVFLLLPPGERGEALLAGIKRNMPNIVITDWPYEHSRRRVRKSDMESAVPALVATLPPGRHAASAIRAKLGISANSTWERLVSKMRDASSDIAKALLEAGCHYEVSRVGRTQRAFLVKGAE